jgi:tRNA(Ile)-lysidine synthase TilS/MesJ
VFDFEVHTGAFPVHRYTDNEKERIGSYWSKRGVDIIWHELAETDEHLENTVDPCFLCQRLRKKTLKTIFTQTLHEHESLVLIVNFSLWDIVSYSIEHILSDIFPNSKKEVGGENSERFLETAQRFYPLLKMKEGYTVFRPLIRYNNNDILKAIEQEDIPTLSIPCKFKDFRPKRILEKYYEKMGLHFEYDHVFDFARKSLRLPDISAYISIDAEKYLSSFF